MIVDLGPPITWPYSAQAVGGNFFNIDNADDGYGGVIRVPRTGDLERFAIRLGSVFTPGNLTGRVETVDGTSGVGTGTLVAAGAEVASQAAVADSWNEFVLGTPAPVTVGDLILPRLSTLSTTACQVISVFGSDWNGMFPYGAFNLFGPWHRNTAWPRLRIMIDGEWVPVVGTWPFNSHEHTAVAIGPATNPDEVGILVDMPATMRTTGVSFRLANADHAADDIVVRLWDPDGSTVVEAVTIDGNQIGSSGLGMVNMLWTQPHTLYGGSSYRVTIAPAGDMTIYRDDVDAGMESLLPGGGHMQWTQRTDAGAWSQVSTRMPCMGLLIDGVSTPPG